MKTIKELMGLEEAEKMKGEDPCWDNYEMIGTKPGKDGRPVPNCVLKKSKKAKSKNEEVEHIEESATVLSGRPTTHAEHHYSTSAGSHSTSHVEKTLGLKRGSISKDKKTYIKHGDVHVRTTPAGKHVHVSLARKHGKFGQDTSKHDQQRESLRSKLLKTNEEVELDEAVKKKLTLGSKVSHPIHGKGTVVSHSLGGGTLGTVVKFADGKKVRVDHKKLKTEEVESVAEETEQIREAKVGDTVSFHHELKSAPGSKVKKSGTVEKVDGDVVHVKVKDKYGVKRHQIKMGDLVKEETENVTEMENRSKENDDHERREYGPEGIKQRNKKTQELLRKVSPAMRKKLRLPEPKEGVSEETEQIDELNKDTVYSYNKKADADIEKKHKTIGQLMRKGEAAGANKAAHQINRRLAGMERAEKRLNTEEIEVEESKKIPASGKPVDPKDLVVSLKDVPVKKPRGHTQYDPSKEFPGVKALKREETELGESTKLVAKHGDVEVHSLGGTSEGSATSVRKNGKEIATGDYDRYANSYFISHHSFGKGQKSFDSAMDVAKHFSSMKEEVEIAEEAPPIQVRASYTQAYAKHHKTGKKPSEAVAAAYEDVAKKHGYDMVKKLKAHHASNEQVETAAQVTKHFEKGQSTPSGVPKWVAEPLKKKKKVAEASDAELMGGAVSKPTASGNNPKLADKFMKAFRKMKSPANISCKTVGMISTCEDTEQEFNNMFTEAMKKKPEASSKQTLKKGEKLSGKQEPITISPEIEKKGVA